ncbi:hypothetical protein HELRODRAFT_192902 [Helobdella robusta]|uniref:Protein sleepless n=1 Tax=Helobdella robusta TaxID=6412 RepID=T1FUE6_HELRO|nr:hypothetical protein HELRODRAFT_192902 [Helobdella robusta]ESN98392.1 hypothetical protein HELRODRAFT_192902 [Helobdella robusta]
MTTSSSFFSSSSSSSSLTKLLTLLVASSSFVVIILTTPQAEAYSCYRCEMSQSQLCGDPFNNKSTSAVTHCTGDVCIKVKIEKNGGTFFERDCFSKFIATGCQMTQYNGMDAYICACALDHCNGSARLGIGLESTLPILVIAVVVSEKFTCAGRMTSSSSPSSNVLILLATSSLFVVILTVQPANAVKCYECDSDKVPYLCAEIIVKGTGIKECNGYTCVKFAITDGKDEKSYSRACTKNKSKTGYHNQRFDNNTKFVHAYVCHTDLCNDSVGISSGISTRVIVGLSVIGYIFGRRL